MRESRCSDRRLLSTVDAIPTSPPDERFAPQFISGLTRSRTNHRISPAPEEKSDVGGRQGGCAGNAWRGLSAVGSRVAPQWDNGTFWWVDNSGYLSCHLSRADAYPSFCFKDYSQPGEVAGCGRQCGGFDGLDVHYTGRQWPPERYLDESRECHCDGNYTAAKWVLASCGEIGADNRVGRWSYGIHDFRTRGGRRG